MSILSRSKFFFKEKWMILLLSLLLSVPVAYWFLNEVHYLTVKTAWEKTLRINTVAYEFEGEIRKVSFHKWETTIQVMSFDSDNSVINQWNIGGKMSDLTEKSILIEDIDADGLPDVSFLQIIGDRVYLAIVPMSLNTNYYHRYYLDSLRFSEMDDRLIYMNEITAFKKKGVKQRDLAVTIFAGHAKYPRKLYLVDFLKDTVSVSKTDGNGIMFLTIEDIDGDSLPEFYGESTSPGNMRNHSELAFHDSSTYLMVFDENLQFEFPPVEFKTHFSRQQNFSFPTDSGNYFLTAITDNSSPRRVFPAYLIDLNGRLIDSLFIGSISEPNYFWKESTGIYAYTSDNEIYRILDFKKPDFLKIIKDLDPQGLKFEEIENGDGYFFQISDREIHIYDSNFKVLEEMESDFIDPLNLKIENLSGSSLEKGRLLLQDGTKVVLLEYKKNRLWRLRFFLVPTIFLIGFYIMNVLSYLLSFQQNKRLEREKEITELRFNAVKNQLEPHFLFNSLNSIGHLLLTEERMKAYSYLESLSYLLRNAINNSSEIAVPLAEEILFTKKYLEIEKLRFEDKFDFEIIVDEDVNTEFPIPKMIIQLHSENAVKHGVLHKETGGKIDIRVYYIDGKLKIEIEDNGPGRFAYTETKKNLGKGHLISEQMLELYQKVMKNNIEQEIIDKTDSFGEALGTHIIITIVKDPKA